MLYFSFHLPIFYIFEKMSTTAEDNAKSLIHSNIKYLHDLCQNKDLDVPALKSLFWTKCKLMELRTKVQLPSEQYKTSVRCSRCFLERNENSKYQVQSMHLSKFEQKLVAKVQKNTKKVLTKYQSKCLDKIKKKFPDGLGHKQNQMVIICNSCNQKSTIRMLKPKEVLKTKQGSTPKLKTREKKTVKKKKNTDSFCGLKPDAVSQAQTITNKKKNKNKARNTSNESAKSPLRPLLDHFKNSDKKADAILPSQGPNKDNLSGKTANLLNKAKPPGQTYVQSAIQTRSKNPRPNTSKTHNKPNDRMFATSDFIPLKSNSTKFKLTKKRVVKPVVVEHKQKKRVKKKGNKTLSEKAKLELFLQSM